MKCPDEIVYQQFIDGELPPAQKELAAVHLKECRRCRQSVERMKAENIAIGTGFEIDGQVPDLEPAVMDRIVSPGSKGKAIFRWLLPIAASILLLVLLHLFVLTDSRGPMPAAETRIMVHAARVEGAPTRLHIYDSRDPEVKFIWLQKIQ